MSMPTFPTEGLELTQEEAFNMLLGSIAMEELALSHIINSEGEKLQYVLGTLEGSAGPLCPPTVEDVLKVNGSIITLLENVAHNQILLKGKLERVLDAKEKCLPPCKPPEPAPGCGEKPYETCVFQGVPHAGWKEGEAIAWRPASPCKSCACACGEGGATSICIDAHRVYLISCTLKLRLQCGEAASIALQGVAENGTAQTVLLLEADAADERQNVTLSGSAVFDPTCQQPIPTELRLVLCSQDTILLERAVLSLTAL